MKINEYNQMMSYLTRPAKSETEYEEVAMTGPFIKGGKKVIDKLIKKGKVKKGEAPKTDVEKVQAQKKSFDQTEKELAKSGQIPVKDQTDPNTLTTEQLIEFRKTNRAGKGQFTNAEAIIARLENTLKDIKPDDETYNYVTTTFPNFIKELKANPKLAENENVWNSLMSELPSDQRFIKYDDGTVDFQTKKTTHSFKLREDLDTDRKGPNVPDDDPNMFDDMFDRMQKQMQDYIPGEEPLTKKKRTLNAEGGVIGGGMIEGEDLGSRTGFALPRILPKEDVIRFLKEGKTKAEIAEFFKTGRNTLDKNIDILISEGELDPSYGRNQTKPTSKRAKLISLINEANSNFKTEKFSKLAEKAGYAKNADRSRLVNFPKLNTSKENVTKYFDSLMSDLNKPASEFKNIIKKISDYVGVSDDTVRTSLKNHENYKINKKALHYVGIPMAQKTVSNPDITFLDIAERFETEGSMRKNSSSKRMSGGYASAEQKIMDYAKRHVEQGGTKIEFLTSSNVPDSEKKFKYKGKTYDLETLRLKGPKDPNFKEFYEKFYLSKNIGNKKYKHPLTGKQVPLKEIMAEAYTKATGANILPENVFGLDHSKSVVNEPFTNLRVQDYRTNLAGGHIKKYGELQELGALKKEDYTPEKVKFYKKKSGYDFIGNDPDLFVKNQLNLANDIFTKGKKLRQPLEIVKERAASVDDIPTKNILQNVAEGSDKFKNMRGSIDPQLLGIPQIAEGIEKYGIPAAKKAAPYVKTGVKTGSKVLGLEGVFSLPFLGLDTYFGTRPGDVLPNILTLGQYELRQMAPGSPRRAEFAARFGYGNEYINATKKMKDATTMFGGAKDKETLYGLMDKAGIGLTPEEKYAFDVAGGSKFDDYELIRAEQQAQSYDQVKLPKSVEESKDPFNFFIGKPAYKIASEYFQPGKYDTPRYDFSEGGSPKDKRGIKGIETKLPIDPNMPQDPGRRNFLQKMGIGSLGIGALMTGAVKFAPEAAKVAKEAATNVTTQMTEVPNIIKELYATIKNLGQVTDYSKKGVIKTELGPYELNEYPGGYNITKKTDSDYRYQEESFEVQTDPEYGVIDYEELTVRPDMDGKLKDVDYGVELDTYREIGEDLAKIKKDDNLIKIADDDIAKQIEKEKAYKEALNDIKPVGEND